MRLNDATSLALRCCLYAGIAFITMGLILSEQEYGDLVMWIGILILIASPFIGILATYSHLIAEKDWMWVQVTTVLTAMILAFLTVSLLMS